MHNCRGLCLHNQQLCNPGIRRPSNIDFYKKGGKRCTVCDWNRLPCPFNQCECCGSRLRTKPKNREGREKLNG